jgi:hypothetical protein
MPKIHPFRVVPSLPTRIRCLSATLVDGTVELFCRLDENSRKQATGPALPKAQRDGCSAARWHHRMWECRCRQTGDGRASPTLPVGEVGLGTLVAFGATDVL